MKLRLIMNKMVKNSLININKLDFINLNLQIFISLDKLQYPMNVRLNPRHFLLNSHKWAYNFKAELINLMMRC